MKQSKPTAKMTYNCGNDIMKHWNILVEVWFTTSKARLGFLYNKLCIPVVSRIDNQLKKSDFRKPGNIKKILIPVGDRAQCSAYPLQK